MPEVQLDSAPRPEDGLTSAETLIWAGQRLSPGAPLYNMALAIELRGALDVSAFRSAFVDLVRITDALRTTFPDRGGHPVRQVLEAWEMPVELLDLPEPTVSDEEVARLLEERTRRVFPLDGPLFDTALLRRHADCHIWYLNQHHLITDAWSIGVLHRRLAHLYALRARGSSVEGEDPPQFREYIEQEAAARASPRFTRAFEHWRTPKSTREARLEPYGDARPGSGRTDRVRTKMGARRTAQLRELAASPLFRALTDEQSRFLVLTTVLAAWLYRMSDGNAVSIGTPWHNRTTARQRETAGLFIELYPLRVDIEEGETLRSLAAKVSAGTLTMLRHVVPGANASPGARSFEAVLNYITANLGDFADLSTQADWIHSGFGDRQHKLRVQVHHFGGQDEPTLDFDLDAALFGERERRWAPTHFLRLFDALVQDPDQRVADVALTDWAEEAEFATALVETPESESIPAQFRRWVTQTPDAVAVEDGDRELTYRELGERVAALARRLIEEGVGDGFSTVGVCMERSADLVVAVLGVLEAGAAWVPLDPAHPDGRLRFLVRDADVGLVVADQPRHERIRDLGARPLACSDGEPAAPPAPPAREQLAYVLYTSGSTGEPKGVEVTHGALADYVQWARNQYTDGEPLRFALFTSTAFDLTLTSLFTPLVSGGTVVVYGDSGNNLLVRRVLEDDRVDVVKLTPAHLSLLRDLDLSTSRVRRLILGGEDLKVGAARAAWEAFGRRVELLNEYGPTEATVGCVLHRFDPERDLDGSVPIGKPATDTRIYVLDPRGQPVPRGSVGEIWIAGRRLARGYRGRPERTEHAFAADPAGRGGRAYRTGDRGRWRPDGGLDFLGRVDEQVKIRGVRVELGEVEAALSLHPGVSQCVVQVSHGGVRDANCARCGLAAAHPEAQLDVEGICDVCRQYEREADEVARYFGTMSELTTILEEARAGRSGPHDCIMLYSGGKDSTYALCRVVEMGARPLVFLLDNGFISEQAKHNVRRVVDQLGLDLFVAETPAMPEIFTDSLARYSNVCNGCFKTIYTLAMNLASERGIRHIVTGLSRGQIFETRLHDLYRRGLYAPADVDRTVLEARKAYHRMDDAVHRHLDTTIFETDEALERIQFVDFYRYCDDTLDDMLGYVARHTPWIRPSDTGRSTNCLINEAGIWVHKLERGFHNYAMPYSWDVRLGHKQRDAALAELDDELDPTRVRALLDQVGYRERPPADAEARLVAYYTSPGEIPISTLRRFLEETLPGEVVPSAFVRLDSMPLTRNGKVDRGALPQPDAQRPLLDGVFVAPRTEDERALAAVWREVLGLDAIGVHDDFFELGGDSMQCIQIVTLARGHGLQLAPHDVFDHPTISALALKAARSPGPASSGVARASAEELAELFDEFGE